MTDLTVERADGPSGAVVRGLDLREESNALLEHMATEDLVYRHRWSPGTVVLWDNRSLLHSATGGYEGQRRELHRLTIAEL